MKWYLDIKKYLNGALPTEILLYLDNVPGCECWGGGMGDIGMRTVGWGLWDGAVGWGQCMHNFCEQILDSHGL